MGSAVGCAGSSPELGGLGSRRRMRYFLHEPSLERSWIELKVVRPLDTKSVLCRLLCWVREVQGRAWGISWEVNSDRVREARDKTS